MKSSPKQSNRKPVLKLDENNVLSLESFPRFNPHQGNSLRTIARYLKTIIIRSFKHTRISAVDLPSMNRLCNFFKCSQGELLHVLLLLKGQGLDYKIYALDKPIAIWRSSLLDHCAPKTC